MCFGFGAFLSEKQDAKQVKQAKQASKASKASKARSKQSKTQAKLEARKTDTSNRVRAYCLRARGRGTPTREGSESMGEHDAARHQEHGRASQGVLEGRRARLGASTG